MASKTLAANINAGNSPGTLTFDTPLFVAGPDTVFNIEIGGDVAGDTYDLLLFTGNVVLGGTLVFNFIDGFVPDDSNVFSVFQTIANSVGEIGSITFDPDQIAVVVNGLGDNPNFNFGLDGAGNFVLADVESDLVGVPEPSALGLLGVGLIFLGWARRRPARRTPR